MAILSTGNTFGTTDTVTNTKLNNIANAATFDDPVDDSTLELHTDGKLRVKTSGIGTTQIASSSVTKAKIENVANMKVLGNVSGSAAAPAEVSVIDDDTMATASATTLATSESIKAYVDDSSKDGFSPSTYTGGESVTFPNGLIMKWGVDTFTSAGGTVTFEEAFPNGCINVMGVESGADQAGGFGLTSFSATSFSVNPNSSGTWHWQAIGY